MRKKGFIEPVPSLQDIREHAQVQITDKGRRLLAEIKRQRAQDLRLLEQAIQNLAPEVQETFLYGLDMVAEHLWTEVMNVEEFNEERAVKSKSRSKKSKGRRRPHSRKRSKKGSKKR